MPTIRRAGVPARRATGRFVGGMVACSGISNRCQRNIGTKSRRRWWWTTKTITCRWLWRRITSRLIWSTRMEEFRRLSSSAKLPPLPLLPDSVGNKVGSFAGGSSYSSCWSPSPALPSSPSLSSPSSARDKVVVHVYNSFSSLYWPTHTGPGRPSWKETLLINNLPTIRQDALVHIIYEVAWSSASAEWSLMASFRLSPKRTDSSAQIKTTFSSLLLLVGLLVLDVAATLDVWLSTRAVSQGLLPVQQLLFLLLYIMKFQENRESLSYPFCCWPDESRSPKEKREISAGSSMFFFLFFFILLLSPLSWGGCSYSPVTSSAPSSSWVAARSHLIDWMLRVLMEVCPGPTKRKNMVRASEFAMPSLSGRRLRHWRILFWASADGNKHTERCDGRLYI